MQRIIPIIIPIILQFQLDDNSYNMQLYNAVCKACGIDTSDMDEVFEDYQAIYDKIVEMQEDKDVGRKDGGRGRVRQGILPLAFFVWEKNFYIGAFRLDKNKYFVCV